MTFRFQAMNQVHGAGTDQITDAWVYVDDQQIGVFELPCEVPVLLTGSRECIRIFGGGIRQSGLAYLNRSQYLILRPVLLRHLA